MRYIDVRPLLERIIKLEEVALEEASKYATAEDSVRWNRWSAILGERTAFKYDLMDAPAVDAEPVVRCKDCKWSVNLDGILGCRWHGFYETGSDWFCADAERRDDETD